MLKVIKRKNGIVYGVQPKTARVRVDWMVMHKKYKKQFKKTKYFLVEIPKNIDPKPGDKVEIKEVKPISKRKSWAITKILGNTHIIKNTDKGESNDSTL